MKIDDIAKLANVSKSAVSLALNGKEGVSQETRDKVLKIAEDNGYIARPLVMADQYQLRNLKFIRFVACTSNNFITEQYESLSFFMELIGDISKQMALIGYSLIISSVNAKHLEEEIRFLEKNQKSTGILLLGTDATPEKIKLISKIQPNLVVLDTCFDTLDINFITMNNLYGAHQAGNYLIRLGHKKIGYVASNTRIYNFEMRKKAFFQTMKEHNLSILDEHCFSISPTIITSQDVFKENILALKGNLPTALFCEADYMAISVIKSLTELGIKVPDDISIIGFDNIFEAKVIVPELTTIHVKKDKLAQLAVEKLVQDAGQSNTDKIKLFLDTEIIERKSCKKLN